MVTAIVKFDKLQLVLNFLPNCKSYHALLYGDQSTVFREIDITNCYVKGFERFAEMLRTGKAPLQPHELYKPVELLNARCANPAKPRMKSFSGVIEDRGDFLQS